MVASTLLRSGRPGVRCRRTGHATPGQGAVWCSSSTICFWLNGLDLEADRFHSVRRAHQTLTYSTEKACATWGNDHESIE